MRHLKSIALAAALIAALAPAKADPGLQFVPLGYCQMTTLSAAASITAANCVRASFTGTVVANSPNRLTAASVTGLIQVGDLLAGAGVPSTAFPNGTYVVSQISGTPGGAGVYQTSNPVTSSGASLTSGGIPLGATRVMFTPETQAIRWRDDKQAPSATVGMPLAVAQLQVYQGTLPNLQFFEQTASAKLNLSFYR